MTASKVFFTDFHSHGRVSQLEKLEKLIRRAGFDQLDLEGKFVAIKLHFGELGNLAFLRPNYAKVVADLVREKGGKPFLTDCNTLYVGSRKDALEHLETAALNGYSPYSTGCQILIGDGLKGSDDVEVPVVGGKYVQNAKIGRAIMDADVFISLTHFKGHEQTGFGGALKNIGMGCGSRRGKMEMHNAGKPIVHAPWCVGCGACRKICAHDAPVFENGKCIQIDHNRCVGCGRCLALCPKDAIWSQGEQTVKLLNCKIAEYAKAVVDGRQHFHISIVRDVSPNCDCHGENDLPIVADVGMFASFDPVALDQACADAVNRQPALPGTELPTHDHDDHFHAVHPNTCWQDAVAHGKKIGLGTDEYELIDVKL